MVLEILVPGQPVPKGRPRFGRGHSFTPKRTRDYEKAVRIIAQANGAYPVEHPVRVTVNLYHGDARRRDLDNGVKCLTDALNSVAYKDDSQIVELHATQTIDREYPRAVVRVEEA